MRKTSIVTWSLVLASLLALSSASAIPISDGLIAYFPGEDNNPADQVIEDESQSQFTHNGTLPSSHNVSFVPGKVGNAFDFAGGANDHVVAADHDDLSPHVGSAGEMTISAWVNISAFPAVDSGFTNQSRRPIVAKGSSTGSPQAWEYALYIYSNGAPGFSTWQAPGSSYGEVSGVSTNTVVPTNQWVHLVGTIKKGDFVRIYMNGILAGGVGASSLVDKTTTNGDSPLFLGRRSDGQFFDGMADEIAIYNRALSETEIQVLFNDPFATSNVNAVNAVPEPASWLLLGLGLGLLVHLKFI